MQTQLMTSSVVAKSVFGFLPFLSGDGIFYSPPNSFFSTEIVGEGRLGKAPWRKKGIEEEEETPLRVGGV